MGITLSQIGEFSFVLLANGLNFGLVSDYNYQVFLAAAVFTMAVTPLLFSLAQSFISRVNYEWSLVKKTKPALLEIPPDALLDKHVVIVGFGITGSLVAAAARFMKIPYIIVEMNAATVNQERAQGEKIVYGDAANGVILEHVNINKARALVITSTAPALIRRIIASARTINSNIHIITRTRFMQETEELHQLGANEVVPEEFETALEVFARVLRHMFVPENDIARLIQKLRNDNYETLLHMKPSSESFAGVDQYLPDLEFRSLRVEKGSRAQGRDMATLALRPRYAVTVLAMQRGGQTFSEPDPAMVFKADDIVVLLGKSNSLDKAQEEIFSARPNVIIRES